MLSLLLYVVGLVVVLGGTAVLPHICELLAESAAALFKDTRPITPAERVSHVLTESGQKLRLEVTTGARALLLAEAFRELWTGWVPTSVVGLAVLFTFAQAAKLIVYTFRRSRLIGRLVSESAPNNVPKNRRTFVIHRDVDRESVIMFDTLSRLSANTCTSIIQYSEIAWPQYRNIQSNYSGRTIPTPFPSPESVAKAAAVVWLDLAPSSPATESELAEAKRLSLPIVRIARSNSPGVYIVERGGQIFELPDGSKAAEQALRMVTSALDGELAPSVAADAP
jgi:hypothetical protein